MKRIIKFCILFFFILLSSGLVLFFLPKPTLLEDISFSTAIYDEHQQLLRLTLSKDDKFRMFTPLAAIPKQVIAATLLQEDRYFYKHLGFNPWGLVKAVWHTYVIKARRIGASTITMQLARIRFSIHSKTLSGKVWQVLRAIQIEMHYSKNQIIEAYLNLAPYGGNIEGIGAASLIYFKQPLKNISLPEILTLSVIPQNPSKRTPHNTHLKTIRNHLFTRWLGDHPEDSKQKALFDLPLVMHTVHDMPFYAPHFVTMVLNKSLAKELNIKTTLYYPVQQIIEKITTHFLARKKSLKINNAAVLLVDSRDMSIKGLLGSADFFNKTIEGQINGVETRRSPGSTLKPFIYGLALDQGLIHPNTVLKDVPHSFHGYNPENFDYDFMGPIKAKEALVLSRNVPAIDLSNQLTNPNLYQLLEKAQIHHLKPESHYGLSLNLGGAELTMQELVSLYAALVNDGMWHPTRFIKNQPLRQGQRLLSPEASFLVLDMLKNNSATSLFFKNTLLVAWKTGTSSGFRDAWTVGAFGPYVLAVWLGNFNNKSNPALVGRVNAAPLFFELIAAIQQELGPIKDITKPAGLYNIKKIPVCKASGMLPTKYCKDTELSWFIPGKSPIKTDTIFREVAINKVNGLRTCHIDNNTRFAVFEFWPSDLLTIFKKAGIQRHTPPLFEPKCNIVENKAMSPQITSPQSGISYVIHTNSRLNNKIAFSAVTDADTAHLYWFINETFVAKVKASQTFLWPAKPGNYVVRVVDDHGLSDARDLYIIATN